MTGMLVELLDREALAAVWEAWDLLHRDDPLATPFTSPGWAKAWLSSWAPDAQPWVLAVRDADRVLGIAPLVLRERRGLRLLHPLGKEPGDYWDILAEPHARRDVCDAVAAELVRRGDVWDAFVVSCLPPGSPTPSAFAAAGLRVLERPSIPCPGIALPATFDEYLAALPGSRRSNLRRHMRRLDDGDIELRELRDPGELPGAISEFQRLRIRQWEHAGKQLTEQQFGARFRDFMLDATTRLLPSGQALIWEFRMGGRLIGVYVNLVDDKAFYWYLGGFDPDHARLGLGKIAVGLGIRSSIEAGRGHFDFTRGGEPYKYWYGASDRDVPSLVIGHRGVRSRIALGAARRLGGAAAGVARSVGNGN
jgi:CelD/BcsL family acetyltransferase involved in cellulose biosynthesis